MAQMVIGYPPRFTARVKKHGAFVNLRTKGYLVTANEAFALAQALVTCAKAVDPHIVDPVPIERVDPLYAALDCAREFVARERSDWLECCSITGEIETAWHSDRDTLAGYDGLLAQLDAVLCVRGKQ